MSCSGPRDLIDAWRWESQLAKLPHSLWIETIQENREELVAPEDMKCAYDKRSVVWHQASYCDVCVAVHRRRARSLERLRGEATMEAMNTQASVNSRQRAGRQKRQSD